MPAVSRAINRAAVTVRAEAARELAKQYRGLRIGAIKARIKQTERATRSSPRAVLRFSASRIPLVAFRLRRLATKWGTGIATAALPAGLMRIPAFTRGEAPVTREQLRSAFVQRSRRGTANVWLRQGKPGIPIDVIVAPSLSRTLAEKKIDAAMLRVGYARFQAVFAQDARNILRLRSGG